MIRYSEELLEELRQANDIVDVISQYVHLKRSGRNFFGLCPFHNEKSPSFSVSPDKQIFHCFGCGVGGNVLTFIQKIEGVNFREAVEMLAERSNIQLPKLENQGDNAKEELKSKVYNVNKFAAEFYHKNLYKPTAKIAQDYVKRRKLNNETLISYQIGYSGKFNELYMALKQEGFGEQEMLESGLVNKNDRGGYIDRYRNRLMIPIFDTRNRVIGFGGRILEEDKSKSKYINSNNNIVFDKGRNLFGLNVAKKENSKELLIVEGYMDVISLHQRGIKNVVASLGTALTQQQGWLLRKNAEKVILSFDADGAGQNAIVRSLDVLQNMGLDLRILQIDGEAKDPDEYILKYGPIRFQKLIQNAISLVEFKVKVLKKGLDLENVNDKIKFLNGVANIISKIENSMEREIYIEKIAKTYGISEEAIYAQVNKLMRANSKGDQILERPKSKLIHINKVSNEIPEGIKKRENTIISILLNKELEAYEKLKNKIKPEDFKYELDKFLATKLYEEFEKGNSNISSILDTLSEEERNHATMLLAYDLEIEDIDKAINDILGLYKKERLDLRKLEILEELEKEGDMLKKKELEKELSEIILAKIK